MLETNADVLYSAREEIKNQWKYLKRQYYKIKKQLLKSGMGAEGRQWKPFTKLDELLMSRPRTTVFSSSSTKTFCS